jgi:hypothetical protein
MTDRIEPPKVAAHHPDRGIDCEFALEAAFQALVNTAEMAGWSATEVSAALISLADAHELGRRANAETDEQIRSAEAAFSQKARQIPALGRPRPKM